MSDEAFARRFYSDRAELLALGVPLQSQRDEFTGEELYTLRSEQYFLPQLELEDEELAALQTALFLLEGKFAYAEPLRLALQNLALGRPGFAEALTETAGRVEVFDPDYSPEMPGRLAKLEGAISKQRTVKFEYWSISSDKVKERTLNPYALAPRQRHLVRRRPRSRPRRHPHVPRLAHPRRDQVRDAARARLPDAAGLRRRAVPRPAAVADRRAGRRGAHRGARRHRLVGAARVRRHRARRGRRLRHGVLVAAACSRRGCCARTAAPSRSSRRSCGARSRRAPARARAATRARRRACAERPAKVVDDTGERPAGPVAPERFAVLQALLAYLLARLRRRRGGGLPRDGDHRALPDPRGRARGAPLAAEPRQLRRRLLHGLRRAARRRRARRQGALGRHVPDAAAADAARGARDPPRARVRRADDRRRRAHAARARAPQARGDVRAVRARADAAADDRARRGGSRLARSRAACAS